MQIIFSRLCAVLIILAALTALSAGPARALEVTGLRFGEHTDKTRLVIDLSDPAPYRVFTLSSPYRLVIDLPPFTWEAGPLRPDQLPRVRDIRQGRLDTDTSRLVLDLETPILLRKDFQLPAASGRPDRLVIDYSHVSPSAFRQADQSPRGPLHDGATGSAAAQSERGSAKAVQAGAVATPQKSPQRRKPLIILDAGHGGVDPGAIGANGLFEKHVTLAMARELKQMLEDSGKYRVRLTRNDDTYLRLYKRVSLARAHGGDLFISLHADSIEDSNVRGASVYTLSETASDRQTAKLATRENRADLIAGVDLNHERDDVANILIDLAVRDTMNQSKFFANTLVEKMRSHNIKILQNPHRYAGFAVLKAPDMPAVLVEIGFMSNPREARLLNTRRHRLNIARAIRSGIDSYFSRVARFKAR